MSSFFKGKTVLVTGGTGSIGSEIVRQLLAESPKAIRIFSRDEHKQFLLQKELAGQTAVRYLLGDIRDKERLSMAMRGVDYVFHCGAYKHVPLCEYNALEAVKTNVIGTQNIIEAAVEQEVERVLLVSTDKAASPPSVMGATKMLAERLVTSAIHFIGRTDILFGSVRFGNVIGSRGSVLPTFRRQIEKGGPLTITDPTMTRFFMSIQEAVGLTFSAMEQMTGGEVFVLKMPVAKIGDLADVAIEEIAPLYGKDPASIEKKIIGCRPGERMQEVLMTEEEAQLSTETDTMFIVRSPLVLPGEDIELPPVNPNARAYSSSDKEPISKEEVRTLVQSFLDGSSGTC